MAAALLPVAPPVAAPHPQARAAAEAEAAEGGWEQKEGAGAPPKLAAAPPFLSGAQTTILKGSSPRGSLEDQWERAGGVRGRAVAEHRAVRDLDELR
ncbi:unnamed protein product [Prorocentrum cordatum]|uniref:Uncharacterized protein n=1 Tax=Prorocentrum cordatum TaxID=2364126 RepID=A0ABN9U6S1_9DINO|nr:unnamed protein product [Polarella glacialis]